MPWQQGHGRARRGSGRAELPVVPTDWAPPPVAYPGSALTIRPDYAVLRCGRAAPSSPLESRSVLPLESSTRLARARSWCQVRRSRRTGAEGVGAPLTQISARPCQASSHVIAAVWGSRHSRISRGSRCRTVRSNHRDQPWMASQDRWTSIRVQGVLDRCPGPGGGPCQMPPDPAIPDGLAGQNVRLYSGLDQQRAMTRQVGPTGTSSPLGGRFGCRDRGRGEHCMGS